ncbi:VOC family protein [Allonocardiopsis opalescens]|uniref:Glyoxalase/bleomycin resistance protein/dioxygenase superfamily protein n=1 Tax=Allonocardiopsis opalescens TaxID=1144618 RepID=A0A2T0Q6T4_9ACTN|nr:VOC family protein [Allonocardiopsis opalescens]PRX99514.1 glyoxalase/bleomycin resistance protein/dioxygenase superfamily protein [Allonocardiopsis opalescens]
MGGYYHVCFVVPELERAMADLGRAGGVEWSPVREDVLGPWEYRIVFSRGGPPYFELIEGPPGSPWDCGGAARFDHVGFWTESITARSRRLADGGFPVDFDGCPYGRPFAYHRVDSIGARVELVDVARRPAFESAWGPGA